MKAVIDDTNAIYVQDDTPNNETQYRTRFYVHPNSLTMATNDVLDLFIGRNTAGTDVLRIQLQKTATSYQIRSGLLNDAGTWTDTSWYDVPNSWTAVEIHYQAFANSGSLSLWLDDVQKQSLTFIDNDARTITDIRLGAQGVETGTSGTIYFDDFESRRFSYIGTLPDPGVNDPQATNPAGWTASTYSYSTTIPHAVTSMAIESGGTNTYEYDANGNMTCRIENDVIYTHTYNAENRASSIAKRNTNCTGTIIESWSFAYDGDGTRVLTAHFTGTSGTPDSTTAYYMGGQFEVKDGTTKKYYSIAGMMVAVNDGTALQYLLTDHLGSTVAVTNSSGTLTSQQRYLPFGEARSIPNSPIAGTDFTYTGQRMLDSGMGGIMDYKSRFYSPYINRFLQPDTIIPDQTNPQSWNRFAYVLNNPVRFNDPSGHVCSDPEDPTPSCESDPLPSPIRSGGGTVSTRWAGGGNRNDPPSVLTEEQLAELGLNCGENVAELTCQLYTNPSAFDLEVHADFPDWLYLIANPNYGTAASCVILWQGCIFEGLNYTLLPNVYPNPTGGIDWNRDVEYGGIVLPLFHANWQTSSFQGAPAAIEQFPLRDGSLGYTTAYLRPSAVNNGITWTSNTASYNGVNFSLPGTIRFTTQQTGQNSIQTVGSFTLPGGIVIGQVIINGTLK